MPFDTILMNAIHGLAGWSGILDAAGVFLARYFPFLLAIPLILFLLKKNSGKARVRTLLFWALVALLSRGIFTETIRFFFPRPRPFEVFGFSPLISETGSSFPSGHAALLFALSCAVFAVNKKWGWWFIGLSLLNGVARVFVGVHYPLDIAGGFLVALVSCLVATRILRISPSDEEKQDILFTEEKHEDPSSA